jgi:WD40 repeat protein/serine/threonine protein kinase/tetratricopeptide (TPR) repeat protein
MQPTDRDQSQPPDAPDSDATRWETPEPPADQPEATRYGAPLFSAPEATRYGPLPAPPSDSDGTKYRAGTPSDAEGTRYGASDEGRAATGAAPDPVGADHSLPRRFGNYDLLERVARGGMGVVYRARQLNTGRVVALKMILRGAFATAGDIERFRVEARAAAGLDHPGIVPIYDVGEAERLPYYTMAFMGGGSLQQLLAGGPLPPKVAAGLLRQLSEAVQYAHDQGIIHRDIKPQNVLLNRGDGAPPGGTTAGFALQTAGPVTGGEPQVAPSGVPVPRLTDFGLARLADGGRGLSVTGEALGTPSYMPPEQASGDKPRIGRAADVYSLGAVLYCCLTGRPPFQSANELETLRQVREVEALPPRRLNPAVPVELQTVCLKCLEKDPARRYVSAAALAADLQRFTNGEPILAVPAGPLTRTLKWARRRPAVAGLVSALALLAGVMVVGSTVAAVVFRRIANDAERARVGERAERERAEREYELSEKRREEADHAHREADASRRAAENTLADMHTAFGLHAAERGVQAESALWFARAATLSRNDPRRQETNAVRAATQARLAVTPLCAIPPAKEFVSEMTFCPRGTHLIRLTQDGECAIWDLLTDKPLSWPGGGPTWTTAAWSPDGQGIALGTLGGFVELRSFPDGAVRQRVRAAGPVQCLAFSPDGTLLAIGGTKVQIWDCRRGELAAPELKSAVAVRYLAFDAKGGHLVAASADSRARVYAVSDGKPGTEPVLTCPHLVTGDDRRMDGLFPVFLGGGRSLVSRSSKTELSWWDVDARKESHRVRHELRNASVMRASPDGARVVVGAWLEARMWDADGRPVGEVMEHPHGADSVDFSPDGQSILTGSGDRAVRLWSASEGKSAGMTLVHQGPVGHVAFAPDGWRFATAQWDGMVRVWAFPLPDPNDRRLTTGGGPVTVKAAPAGSRFIVAGAGWWEGNLTEARVYDAGTGQLAGPALKVGHLVTDAALSPDDATAAVLYSQGRTPWERYSPDPTASPAAAAKPSVGGVRFWNWRTGQDLYPALPTPSEPRSACFTPDGRLAAVLCGGGQLLLIDVRDGKVVLTTRHGGGRSSKNTYPRVTISPDGKTLATSGPDYAVEVRDLATGQLRYERLEHTDYCVDTAFSPDGRFLATASWDGSACVWDAVTGKPAIKPLKHPGRVVSVRFSPDGSWLLTSCHDRAARVWNWRETRLVCPPLHHKDEVHAAVFTPDGHGVLTGSIDMTGRLWDCQSGKPLTPPIQLAGRVGSVAVTPDGAFGVLAGTAYEVRAYPLHGPTGGPGAEPADLLRVCELLAGQRVDDGALYGLTSAEWLERWGEYRKANSATAVPAGVRLSWHRQELERYIAAEAWPAVLQHLDQILEIDPSGLAIRVRLGRTELPPLAVRGYCHAELGRPEAAVADFSKALEADPESGQTYAFRGWVYERMGDDEKALADYTEGLRRVPDPGWLYGRRGDLRVRRKESDGALADYTKAIELQPGDVSLRVRRGEVFANAGEEKSAIFDLSVAANLAPRDPAVFARRATALARFSRWPAAAADYDRAINLGDKSLAVRAELAHIRLRLGDVAGYEKVCREALKRFGGTGDPETAAGVARMGVLRRGAVEDPRQLVRLAEVAVAAEPANARYANTLGAALLRSGDSAGAVRRLAGGVAAADPEQVWGLIFRALAHRTAGDLATARAELDSASKWLEGTDAGGDGQGAKGAELSPGALLELRLLRDEAAKAMTGM